MVSKKRTMARGGKEGKYGNLTIEQKRLDKIKRDFDMKISPNTDLKFTPWVATVVEDAISREIMIDGLFPTMHFVGKKKEGGIVIQDRNELVEITVTKKSVSCNVHKGICEHALFASLHPLFTE